MALTKIQEPNLITPVNDIMPIVYGSDNADQDGFRYKLTLDNTSTDIVDIWIWPDPSHSNIGAYNAQQIYRDYLSFDKASWDAITINFTVNLIMDYNYTITEYIGSTSGDTATGTTDFYTFRGVSTYDSPFDYTDYMMSAATYSDFLSNWSGNRIYKLTQYAAINAFYGNNFSNETSYFDRLKITVGGIDYYIRNTLNQSYGIYSMPIGPQNINDAVDGNKVYVWNTEVLESNDIITSTTTEYTCSLWLSGATWERVSEIITNEIDDECYKWDGTQFMWLGDLSTFETFTFNFANIKEYKINRDETKKDLYTLTAGAGYNYSTGDRERKTVNVSTIEKHKASSGWIDDTTSSNLMELYRSSEVYIVENNELYPIIITTTKIEEKTVRNNQLFNHNISYEMSYDIKNNL